MQSPLPQCRRTVHEQQVQAELVVVGGGLAGVLAAVRAARDGIATILIQDRPVLGGNASKEIGVPALGAGGGNNSYYFRETGLLEELLLENLYRNPEGYMEYWDATLLDLVHSQAGLTLYLNTAVDTVHMAGERIIAVEALTLSAETRTTFTAEFFVDASGDGVLGALAGAPFRQGREARAEFAEPNAPEDASSSTMGATITFWGRDMGHPVPFVRPSWARILQEADFKSGREPLLYFGNDGNILGDWWIETGHGLDHVQDAERIRFAALSLAYGVWDYIKSRSPKRELVENYALIWVSSIAGKRESRRFEGDYMLTENDILAQQTFADAVAFGGWSLDDHAEYGFDDDAPGTIFRHLPGLYQIPLRSLYSRTVPNLFFAGRNVSVTHRALSSTRLICTCALLGEAVGRAAALCLRQQLTPRQLAKGEAATALQQSLLLDDHELVGVPLCHPANLAPAAVVDASSYISCPALEHSDARLPLTQPLLHMAPVSSRLESIAFLVDCAQRSTLHYTLYLGDEKGNYFPHQQLYTGDIVINPGDAQWVTLPAPVTLAHPGWVFVELSPAPLVVVHTSGEKLPGVNSMQRHPRVLNSEGVRPYEFVNDYSDWVRVNDIWRTRHQTACFRLQPAQEAYAPGNVANAYLRPYFAPNLWVSARTDFSEPEWLQLTWETPVLLKEVRLLFDTDLDYFLRPIRTVHPFRQFPECVRDYRVEVRRDGVWATAVQVAGNYQRLRIHPLDAEPVDALRVVVERSNGAPQARIYAVLPMAAPTVNTVS
ncbi:MAG TPA: FAD-dependent oxidoreductase [Armatimonadota bacterium]|jgi:hypothetical protein